MRRDTFSLLFCTIKNIKIQKRKGEKERKKK